MHGYLLTESIDLMKTSAAALNQTLNRCDQELRVRTDPEERGYIQDVAAACRECLDILAEKP